MNTAWVVYLIHGILGLAFIVFSVIALAFGVWTYCRRSSRSTTGLKHSVEGGRVVENEARQALDRLER